MSGRGAPVSHKFFTIPETAERLKVSPKTVRRMIAQGVLKVHRFGKQLRIAEVDLAAFIEDCRE